MSGINEIQVDGVKYQKVTDKHDGNRAVVVLNSGWIYAGDVEDRDGRLYLTRVVWVFNWSSIGFDGVLANPQNSSVDIRAFNDLDLPSAVELFRIPVAEGWGL